MSDKKPVNKGNLAPHLVVGKLAETLALEHLQKQGLKVLQRQFRSKTGEIDLIMRDKDELVFVEVRYRHKLDLVDPLETITPQKIRKIISTAQHYLQYREWTESFGKRFDVVTVLGDKLKPKITWISDAFQVKW